jgi:hypothetical protein
VREKERLLSCREKGYEEGEGKLWLLDFFFFFGGGGGSCLGTFSKEERESTKLL